MTTIEAGRAGTIRTDTVRAPFRCAACGELLYTRALACPHCGAPDPASTFEAATAPAAVAAMPEPPVEAPWQPSADVREPPAEAAGRADLPAVDTPAIDAASAPIAESAAAGLADAAPEPPAYAELEPVDDAAPRTPRPPTGSRLDIAPDPYDDDDLSDSRDLVLVPERGGRTVMLPEPRRRGRLLGIGLTLLVLVGIAAAGVLGWRMLAGPAAVASQELSVGTGWTAVELDGAGEWVVTADAPFRIRVDGTVYTVGGPSGFAVPLTGRSVAVRAVSGTAKVTLARR